MPCRPMSQLQTAHVPQLRVTIGPNRLGIFRASYLAGQREGAKERVMVAGGAAACRDSKWFQANLWL